jgi:hypothetical protein
MWWWSGTGSNCRPFQAGRLMERGRRSPEQRAGADDLLNELAVQPTNAANGPDERGPCSTDPDAPIWTSTRLPRRVSNHVNDGKFTRPTDTMIRTPARVLRVRRESGWDRSPRLAPGVAPDCS